MSGAGLSIFKLAEPGKCVKMLPVGGSGSAATSRALGNADRVPIPRHPMRGKDAGRRFRGSHAAYSNILFLRPPGQFTMCRPPMLICRQFPLDALHSTRDKKSADRSGRRNIKIHDPNLFIMNTLHRIRLGFHAVAAKRERRKLSKQIT